MIFEKDKESKIAPILGENYFRISVTSTLIGVWYFHFLICYQKRCQAHKFGKHSINGFPNMHPTTWKRSRKRTFIHKFLLSIITKSGIALRYTHGRRQKLSWRGKRTKQKTTHYGSLSVTVLQDEQIRMFSVSISGKFWRRCCT